MIGVVTRTDLRAAHTRRTRAAIRAAALALTRERGYTAMTIDDVAALAGVSRRTVFNHFSSKVELLVVGPETPEVEAIEAFVAGSGPLLEDLGTLLISGAQALEPERAWLMSFPQIVRDNPEVERAVHERFQAVERVLEDAASRRLGLPSSAPQVRAVLALSSAVQKAAIRMWAASCGADDGTDNPVDGPVGGPMDGRQAGIPDGPGTRSGRPGGRHEQASASVGEQSDPILSLADAVRAVTGAIGEVLCMPGVDDRPPSHSSA